MIAENLQNVLDKIGAAALKSGRTQEDITLVAVSKTRAVAELDAVLAAGALHLGENRVQEAETKRPEVSGNGVWHLIGHLQSNKAKKAASLFDWIDAVDSMKVADILSSTAHDLEKTLDVLVQINISGEGVKSGVELSRAAELASYIAEKKALRLRGIMTIGSFGASESLARAEFQKMRTLYDTLRETDSYGPNFDTLSMGMSGDYEAAIEEGATMVRVGTAIFGQRG